ncbi:unnamed protein product [Dibothriocephalus latus]|uniref:FAD/NAD(P)-binding domain-containing protein n=1 Tax=Dibothriocephalus latus TaxID=60516 RepID=A0A3P6R748_DIBLA|nr:unnamed protein product [Dibothriocephalus latus]
MIGAIQEHIHSLNFGYRSLMISNKVTYLNALGEIINPHTVKTTSKTGVVKNITARTIALATGERPRYPSIPGAKEFGITRYCMFKLCTPVSPRLTNLYYLVHSYCFLLLPLGPLQDL